MLTSNPDSQGPAAPAGSTVINIDPPVIGDEDDSEDESDEDEVSPQPLTSEGHT